MKPSNCMSTGRKGKRSIGDRRQALKTLGIGGLFGAMAAGGIKEHLALAQKETANTKGYVDSHVHVWTPDTARYPLSENFKSSDMVPKSFTPEELFRHTKANGVGRVVLIQMNFYEFDNSYMTDCIAKYPGIFAGVGIVDHSRPGVVDEMRRLKDLGVKGFRLYATQEAVSGWSKDEGIRRMWEEGARSDQAMCLLSDPGALSGIAECCSKFPDTPVVIDHFSRIGMKGPVQEDELGLLCSLAKKPNVYLKTSAFYSLGNKASPYTDLAPMIYRVVEAFGSQRLMWGSDCPYQVEDGHNYSDSLKLIRDGISKLSDEDKNWMLGKTAEKLFF